MAGDVGIVPRNMGHFIENLSDDEPLEVLEIFRAGKSNVYRLHQAAADVQDRRVPRLLPLPVDGRDAEAPGTRPLVPARPKVRREVRKGCGEREERRDQEPVREVSGHAGEGGLVRECGNSVCYLE